MHAHNYIGQIIQELQDLKVSWHQVPAAIEGQLASSASCHRRSAGIKCQVSWHQVPGQLASSARSAGIKCQLP